MIKLKTLLKETKAWERKFGEPLPTLDSVMKKHQENKLNESPVSVLKPANVFDGRNILDKEELTSLGFSVFSIGK